MPDGYTAIAEDGAVTLDLIDEEVVTVAGHDVRRQRVEVAGAGALEIARVTNAAPGSTDYGLVVREVASQVADGGASVVKVDAAVTSTVLFAANGSARLRLLFNKSTSWVWVKFGAMADPNSSFTFGLGPNGFYEFPKPLYTGAVEGIWDTATGFVMTTEG